MVGVVAQRCTAELPEAVTGLGRVAALICGSTGSYAWMTSTRTSAPGASQLAQDWFCPYCTGPYFQ